MAKISVEEALATADSPKVSAEQALAQADAVDHSDAANQAIRKSSTFKYERSKDADTVDLSRGKYRKATRLAGIDLAWISEKNGSGIAIGEIAGNRLILESIETNVIGLNSIISIKESVNNLTGVAIDAPLIIKNPTGNRPCEEALNRKYSSRGLAAIRQTSTAARTRPV